MDVVCNATNWASILPCEVKWDAICAIVFTVAISGSFGAMGGAANSLVFVLEARRAERFIEADRRAKKDSGTKADGSATPSEIAPSEQKEAPFIDASFKASAFIGAASAIGFVFFIISILSDGSAPDLDAVMALKLMSLGVITGYAGRQLLPRMGNNVSEYVPEVVKQVKPEVARQVREETEERIADAVAEAKKKAEAELIEVTEINKKQQEELNEARRSNELLDIDSRLRDPGMISDVSLRRDTIKDAKAYLKPGPGRLIAKVWLDYARALKWDGRFMEAIKSLYEFIGHVDGKRIEKNINYTNAYFNLACYFSILSGEEGVEPHEVIQYRLAAESCLVKYFGLVAFNEDDIKAAISDEDFDMLVVEDRTLAGDVGEKRAQYIRRVVARAEAATLA